jgi:phosphoglycolate phosphatase-like HAD superfamily hydrolase
MQQTVFARSVHSRMRTVLFDVDGVFLSEERYFDASALCVWELLGSPRYIGLDLDFHLPVTESTIRRIRDQVFDSNHVLSFIKSRGINSNWDMVFLQVSYQLVRGLIELGNRSFAMEVLTEPFDAAKMQEIGQKLRSISYQPDYAAFVSGFSGSSAQKHQLFDVFNQMIEAHYGISCDFFKRNSSLWGICQRAFQEWYIGEELYRTEVDLPLIQPGKPGFLKDEIVIAPAEKMVALVERLRTHGFTLGIATGRPRLETHVPLQEIGLLQHFDLNRVVTASDVLHAEQTHREFAPLSKPHPYCYLKALFTKDYEDGSLLNMTLPLVDVQDVWIVGDSLADYYAAKAIGCKFAATLTGLTGKAARKSFEALDTDLILEDVLELEHVFFG